MQWGFNIAPAHFQEVMNYALSAPCVDAQGQPIPPATHTIYLDDVSNGDFDVVACWENTKVIIASLALWNLPIGIWKCTFLTRALVDVGATICSGEYQLASKSIKTLCIQPALDIGATPRFVRKPQLLQPFHSRLQAQDQTTTALAAP